MYSVQDLLVSHGYKLSRTAAAPHEESHKGRQRVQARGRTGQGLLNGCEDGHAAPPQSKTGPGKGHPRGSDSSHHLQRVPGEPQRSSASRAPDVGFCRPPVLVWTSQPQPGQQQTYWRRRAQEACGLLAPGALEELEVRRMAQAQSLPAHVRESLWEVGGRSENVMQKAVWEEELRAAQWREGSWENWAQPRKLGRHMSDGGGERLFRDLDPFLSGEQVLHPQSKGKSRSLPRVLSPEGLSCTEIPIPLNDGHLPGAPNMPFYPPNCPPHLDPTRHPEKGSSVGAFPRPKFGRPLRPPLYSSYQHSRGAVDNSDIPDGPQGDLCASYGTKSGELRPKLCLLDPTAEPPVYVPPPSYCSPPQPIPNPYLEEAAPRRGASGHNPQLHPVEKASAKCPLPASSLAAGHESGSSPHSPHSPRGLPPQPRLTAATTAPDGSVLYIPFDDPRIRHIRLAQHQGVCEEAAPESVSRSSPFPVPKAAPGTTLLYDTLWHPQTMAPPPGPERDPIFADPTPPWLRDQFLRDGGSSSSADTRDHFGVIQDQQPDPRGAQMVPPPEAHATSPAPLDESPCKAQTRLRKFETGIPTKKSAQKKTNETVFCLVSIPVRSEPRPPVADMNHKDLKQGAAPENGLDKSLALQALKGSTVSRELLPKKGPARPHVQRQANDLSPLQPVRQGGLKSSGSWPGHQYRDQQTQTSSAEEPKTLAPCPAAKVLTATCIDPAAPETQVRPALGPSDCKQWPSAHHLKGQMSLDLSSNSTFSRSPLSTSQAPAAKESLRQPSMEGRGHPASPKLQGDGARGPRPGSSHNKELFGQFLLKPVNRRPWDLISQLESFNKELQEEEGSSRSSSSDSSSSSSSSEESDTERPQEGRVHSTPKNSGFTGNHQELRVEGSPWMLVPEDPKFRAGGRVKNKSESWSDEQRSDPRSDPPALPGPCGGDSQLSVLRGSVVEEEEDETRVKPLAFSPGSVKRMLSSTRSSDSKLPPYSPPADLREPQERSIQGRLEVDPPVVDNGAQQGPVLPQTLTSKPRELSTPDLRSMELVPTPVASDSDLNRSLETVGATEVTPNESLQERAARILGIEVAVESLLPGARRLALNQHPEPRERTCRPVSPREVVVTGLPSGEPTVSADAFYGRRRCGWTQSPLFVGERESRWRASRVAQHPGEDEPRPGPTPSSPPQPESPSHKDAPSTPPFQSTLLHVVGRP